MSFYLPIPIRQRLLGLILLGALGCGPSPMHGATNCSGCEAWPLSAEDALPGIDDEATWRALAHRPEFHTAARTEVVKLILDQRTDTLYFLESTKWQLHYHFVVRHIDPRADHARFNIEQYRRPGRRYLLGSIVRYLDGDHFALELAPGDTMDGASIQRLFEATRERFTWHADALRFRPASAIHERSLASRDADARPPILDEASVLSTMRFQAIVPGEGVGYLRIHRGAFDPSTVRPTDLVVTAEVPEEMPPVAGLVTSRLQAPLAHVAILSRNRGTPDMSLRGAVDDPAIVALEGQLVRLIVTPQDYTLVAATREDAERSWAARRPARVRVPRRHLRTRELVDVCALAEGDVSYAGAKAAQLGAICDLEGVITPGGFVVPFAYFVEHMERSGAEARLAELRTDAAFGASPEARAAPLEALRGMVRDAPLDPTLLDAVMARLGEYEGRGVIFRSSTNAEDLPGFNGAGLYESVVLRAGRTREDVANALKRVFASVWLQRAFEERDWYRIDHERVAMAVMVQPFVSDIVGTGVAITANPFDQARPGVYFNVQARGEGVTAAGSDELPEQFVVYTWSESHEPELLGRSTLTGGRPILRDGEVLALSHLLERIHAHLVDHYGSRGNAVDVEFLLTENPRRFVIVQGRPIQVRYTEGQRYRSAEH